MKRRAFWSLIVGAVASAASALRAQPPAESSLGHFPLPPEVGTDGACEGFVLASGPFSVASPTADDGYYAIGEGATLALKPQTPAWYRARELNGQVVDLVVRPVPRRTHERIAR